MKDMDDIDRCEIKKIFDFFLLRPFLVFVNFVEARPFFLISSSEAELGGVSLL